MKKKRIAPSERMKQELMEGLVSEADPLGEAARRGAQLILQRALEAEACLRAPHRQVSDFLRRERYERSTQGALRGYRNGYESKRVHTAEGTIVLEVPQIRESLERFRVSLAAGHRQALEAIARAGSAALRQRDESARHRKCLGGGFGSAGDRAQCDQRGLPRLACRLCQVAGSELGKGAADVSIFGRHLP